MRSARHIAYVGLGSNLEVPAEQVRRALDALESLPDTRVTGRSSLYGSKPLGPIAQPDFVNAVARLETALRPEVLLAALQALEQALGREPTPVRWGPRRIDLDLLLFDAEQLQTPLLRLPHPGIVERNFVLYPLLELAPELIIPGHGPIAELATRLTRTGLWRHGEDTQNGA